MTQTQLLRRMFEENGGRLTLGQIMKTDLAERHRTIIGMLRKELINEGKIITCHPIHSGGSKSLTWWRIEDIPSDLPLDGIGMHGNDIVKFISNGIKMRFGRWVTTGNYIQSTDYHHKRFYECICDCGSKKHIVVSLLVRGCSRSCGCYSREVATGTKWIHGHHGSKTYRAWQGMKNRCRNRNVESFPRYGGRGITFDVRWENFENFYEDMGLCPDGMSIGRINNDSNYTKNNCRWENIYQQSNNKSNSKWLEIDGKRMTVAQWSRELNASIGAIYGRMYSGWTGRKVIENLPKSKTYPEPSGQLAMVIR